VLECAKKRDSPRAIEEKRRAIQDVLRRNQLTVLSKIDTIDT